MNLDYKIIRKKDLSTVSWSGGTTTELSIYPENAVYVERNFKWRISTAKVDSEESTFTSLPGIYRILMVLEGCMHLKHTGHHEVVLNPLDQDSFMGDWNTICYGKGVDFNLMIREGKGEVNAINIPASSSLSISFDRDNKYENQNDILYFLSDLNLELPSKEAIELKKGDVLILSDKINSNNINIHLSNQNNGQAIVIHTCIHHNE